ncbi:hypothetical protein [Liquorilactobacillus mali]|uniref:Uncharacterized protein n=1 Tax=Liquorilactobacillus mali KCTC 3596 = DSM 20444 TaxID=1046596 RepID=J1F0S2_9LACO|nr:hypothetical protein [Liquorilactobacillus mali]EJE97750.1 hypothetical protein LMA_09163 [Liquorilactobacillus mali KCTC 3596 = DSM 20444]KRN10841.1 hypothetical protein FD00_GL002084 [Liquorilactobacillus mali KCTC 3596 = DSM 20444]
MIIGYDFFNRNFDGVIYDTPIATAGIDEVTLGAGMYDELYVTVDNTVDDKNERPEEWEIKTIMDAKFNNDIEAGSIDGSGHKVTSISMYRREYKTNNDWQLVASFPYDENYDVYTVVDRFVESGRTYEYCIVPVATNTMGDITKSKPVTVEYDDTFVSDLNNNVRLDVDFEWGGATYNKNSSVATPLNGAYPIVSFGNQNYRTAEIKFLPLTDDQSEGNATEINGRAERLNKDAAVQFLNNGEAKVIRRPDGDMFVCVTTNIKTTPKATGLAEIEDVTFDFTEIGKLDYATMDKVGLIASAGKSVYTYDDYGNVLWNSEPVNDDARREYRNSFAE